MTADEDFFQALDDLKDRCFHAGYQQRTGEIGKCLLALPEEIAAKSRELADISMILEEKRAEAVKIRLKAMAQVSLEKVDGKPRYGNADARDAARDALLDSDQVYQTLLCELKAGEKARSETQIDLELLQNKFKAYRSIAMMGVD